MLEIRGITITVVDQTGRELKWDDGNAEANSDDTSKHVYVERFRVSRKMLAVGGSIWLLVIAAVILAIWVGR